MSVSPQPNADEHPDELLTPLAYALSLAPPRAPPFDTPQRALMAGQDPSTSVLSRQKYWQQQQHHHHCTNNTNKSWVYKILNQAYRRRRQHGITNQHPHLRDNRDTFALWLDKQFTVRTWNKLRDEGWFRWIADTLVLLGIPTLVVTSPRATLQFLDLSRQVQTIRYGTHPMHIIHLYSKNNPKSDELIIFVHGGAWGSGLPWMYRLVAQGFPHHNVAVVGYRTYPDADVPGQVKDLSMALQKLQSLYIGKQFTIMGHSSGAHIALVHVVQEAKKLLNSNPMGAHTQQQQQQLSSPYHTFVGISGPYDIVHHYDFEAARGVEEVSPMKAASGLSLDALHMNSPANQLQDLLLIQEPLLCHRHHTRILPSRILLIHGMEDTTVPFTATAELARRLVACGLSPQQLYLAKTGHQDTVLQLMMGGMTYKKIVSWLDKEDHRRDRTTSSLVGLTSRL